MNKQQSEEIIEIIQRIEEWLQDVPDYPDIVMMHEKLHSMDQKMDINNQLLLLILDKLNLKKVDE